MTVVRGAWLFTIRPGRAPVCRKLSEVRPSQTCRAVYPPRMELEMKTQPAIGGMTELGIALIDLGPWLDCDGTKIADVQCFGPRIYLRKSTSGLCSGRGAGSF